MLYSDLNFMLLGWAIERCTHQSLERLFHEVVAEPLGMSETRYRPSHRLQGRIAATERNGDQRLTKELVWGEVHDGNAWALGGVAGHAGLFSTSDDLTRFVQSLLGARGHHVLSAASISSISRTPVGTQPDVRGLGWRLDPAAWGPWPADTLWHTGFTGTSLLVAPSANLGVDSVDQRHSSHAPTRSPRRNARVPPLDRGEEPGLMEPNDLEFLEQLGTEQVRHELADLDQLSVADLVDLMCADVRQVPDALIAAEAQITSAVTDIVRRMEQGGRLIYVGAGTAGRLGMLDAAEAGPTFNVADGQVVGILAGGSTAFGVPIENAEDDYEGGRDAVRVAVDLGHRQRGGNLGERAHPVRLGRHRRSARRGMP